MAADNDTLARLIEELGKHVAGAALHHAVRIRWDGKQCVSPAAGHRVEASLTKEGKVVDKRAAHDTRAANAHRGQKSALPDKAATPPAAHSPVRAASSTTSRSQRDPVRASASPASGGPVAPIHQTLAAAAGTEAAAHASRETQGGADADEWCVAIGAGPAIFEQAVTNRVGTYMQEARYWGDTAKLNAYLELAARCVLAMPAEYCPVPHPCLCDIATLSSQWTLALYGLAVEDPAFAPLVVAGPLEQVSVASPSRASEAATTGRARKRDPSERRPIPDRDPFQSLDARKAMSGTLTPIENRGALGRLWLAVTSLRKRPSTYLYGKLDANLFEASIRAIRAYIRNRPEQPDIPRGWRFDDTGVDIDGAYLKLRGKSIDLLRHLHRATRLTSRALILSSLSFQTCDEKTLKRLRTVISRTNRAMKVQKVPYRIEPVAPSARGSDRNWHIVKIQL